MLPSSLWTLLTSPLLSWRAKLRILTERYRRPPIPIGDESIDAFAFPRAVFPTDLWEFAVEARAQQPGVATSAICIL